MITCISCLNEVNIKVPQHEPALVVNALIDNSSEKQEIILSQTTPFFSSASSVRAALDAKVTIKNGLGSLYTFVDSARKGTYSWQPPKGKTLDAKEGSTITLQIEWKGQKYSATSSIKRVPPIEKISKIAFNEVEFSASDLKGIGDFYLVKTYIFFVFPREDTTAYTDTSTNYSNVIYDASSQLGTVVDGISFPLSIRRVATGENSSSTPPSGSKLRLLVQLHAISLEAATFLNLVERRDREGEENVAVIAFSSFFDNPPSNVYSNIRNADPKGKKAVGLFNVANVSSKSIEVR